MLVYQSELVWYNEKRVIADFKLTYNQRDQHFIVGKYL